MTDTILEYAKGAGPVGEEELPLLEALCAAAEVELTERLREGVSPEDCGPAFPVAAAWLALAGLCAGKSAAGDAASWTAGAVSVSGAVPAGERADMLREQAMRLMAPYVRDSGFCFRGVPG